MGSYFDHFNCIYIYAYKVAANVVNVIMCEENWFSCAKADYKSAQNGTDVIIQMHIFLREQKENAKMGSMYIKMIILIYEVIIINICTKNVP
jgi:hypothetical protein